MLHLTSHPQGYAIVLTNSFLPEELDAPEEVDRLNNDCNSAAGSTKISRLLKRSSKRKGLKDRMEKIFNGAMDKLLKA